MNKLLVAKLSPVAKIPARAHDTDAGYDLSALQAESIASGRRKLIRTGIAVAIPEGHVGYITPRSGLAHRDGVTVLNAPGTIDSGYRGEIKVNLINLGDRPVLIAPGERIAQLVIHPVETPEIEVADFQLLPLTDRGENGHGSTGRNDEEYPNPGLDDHIRNALIDGLARGLSKGSRRRK